MRCTPRVAAAVQGWPTAHRVGVGKEVCLFNPNPNPNQVALPKPHVPEPSVNPSDLLRTLRTTYNGPAYNRALHTQSMGMLPPMRG